MQYTNLIWDFDGMLFDTYPRMAESFRLALYELGVDVPHDDVMPRIKKTVGKAKEYYAAQYNLDAARLMALYQEIEHSMDPRTMVPYSGIPELLQDAVNAGCSHYLYTHRDHTAFTALEYCGMKDLFSGAVTAMDGFPAKPAPDALLHLTNLYDLDPEKTLMLGDRSIDIEAARNAGLRGCLFDPGHFYDEFSNQLRTDSVPGLRALLKL